MYPSKFNYIAVDSVDGAVEALTTHKDAALIAGGQSLVQQQKKRAESPDNIVDINDIDELEDIVERDETVEIGALARHTAVKESSPVIEHASLFSECAGQIADAVVRNQGTFGGATAYADPNADYLPVLRAVNPDIEIVAPSGKRTVPFDEFYIEGFTVDLGDDELITRGHVPKLTTITPDDTAAVGSTYKKHAERSSDYAIVGVAAVVAVDTSAVVVDAKLSIGSAGPLVRPTDAEDAVEGTTLTHDALNTASAIARDAVEPDVVGPERKYKQAMAGTFTEKALQTAYERATEQL
jgi:carbon-monoxide dehydrogenase medium subunit